MNVQTCLVGSEILKLDEQVREDDGHFVHEFFHELVHLGLRNAWLAQAKVERVLKEFFVVRSDVDTDRNS